MIRVPRRVVDQLSSDASRRYPEEACGLLIGRLDSGVRIVTRHMPVKNSYMGERNRRYLIDPFEYMRIEDEAAQMGEMVVGVYHSHPDAPAIPSSYDHLQAVPFLTYVIISVSRGKVIEISAWFLNEVTWKLERESMEVTE
ncbi:MAG: M67 family metallopeptidase [Nitrososphaerota archaeon]